MKKKQKRALAAAIVCMALFGILLASLDLFDVRPIGPQNSSVGLATLNNAAKQCFGKTLGFYNPDDFPATTTPCIRSPAFWAIWPSPPPRFSPWRRFCN